MKDVIRDKLGVKGLSAKEMLIELAKQMATALCGFIMARGAVFGAALPFGLAFAAAVPSEFLAFTAFGCCMGYIIPASGGSTFRYLAALFAIVAIKALLAATTKYASRPVLCGISAGIVTCATGLVTSVGDPKGSVMAVTEAVLSFAGAYFITKTYRAAPGFSKGLKGEELACLLISVNMLLIGAMSVSPGGVSVGRVLCVTFILLVSRFGQVQAGAVCGIVSAFAAAISSAGYGTAMGLALCGLMAGIFASWGKYAQIAALIISSAVGGAVGQDLTKSVGLLIESLFGSAIFLMIPKSVSMRAGKIFSPPAKTVSDDTCKKAVTMRLSFAAGALCDVSKTVDTVAKELSRINSPTFDGVLAGIEKEACTGCSLCVHCWETKKADTVSAVLDMVRSVREGTSVPEGAPEEFKGRCLRPARVGDAVYKYYSDYASRIAAESRIADVRGVVSEQFTGISSMLYDMAAELQSDEAFDDRTASKVVAALKNIDLQATECSCRIDKYGRMTVEIIANSVSGTRYNRMKLLRQVEVCCDRDFEPPAVTESGGKVYITLTERAELTVEYGICQIACSPSGISGDAYSTFSDGKGRAVVILSDGMGSGGRAAVDGAMASGLMTRLLKAGFGYDCSLSILNSAMLFKSTDESLATVDVACIDLFSGRTDMLKAGAAPTVVRRSGKCGVAQSTSLPAGILREVGFDKATVKLRPGDVVVMMSDGVTAEGCEWICAETEAFREGKAQELAEHIAHGAKRRRGDRRPDDITVVVAAVNRAF